MSMRLSKMAKKQSLNSQASGDRIEDNVVIAMGAKLHRANILARIINAFSLCKVDWSFNKIKAWATIRKKCYKKMGLSINRIFRRTAYQHKFISFQKIKQQLIEAEQYEIQHSQKIINSMYEASKSIIFLVLKAKRRQVMSSVFQKIKLYSTMSFYKKRSNQRKCLRNIIQIIFKNKRYAFDKIYSSRANVQKKQKLKNFVYSLTSRRKQNMTWGFWKLRKNLIQKRRMQIQNDIKIFQTKIQNSKDPQIQAIKDKKQKLEEHLSKIQKQKNLLEQQLMAEFKQLDNQRKQLQSKIVDLQQKKISIQNQIEEIGKQINSPFSIDEIYQCIYHNFLLYIHENKQKVYNKEQILSSLTFPLIPIDVPIQTIKQQNKIMQELLSEYLVMFGPKKLQGDVQLPYQYLVKENQVMYKMLLTLLPQVDGDRDDLRVIRDSLFKLNQKVKQISFY